MDLAAKTKGFGPKPLKIAGFGANMMDLAAKTKGFDPKPLKNGGFGPWAIHFEGTAPFWSQYDGFSS